MPNELRVGHGFDAHRWSDDPDRVLVLGGVRFDGTPGLVGHSDADVIAHAVIDALLGGAGLGDIGQLFPDTDPAHRNADSLQLLAMAKERVAAAGWTVVNVDTTVVIDAPKIGPHRAVMESNLTGVVDAPVAVKAKSTEGLAGLGGGVQGHAVALLVRT